MLARQLPSVGKQIAASLVPALAIPRTSFHVRATPAIRRLYASTAPAPVTIADGSFWRSLVPKPLRRKKNNKGSKKAAAKKDWNPATYFIVMFLFIGSMSIQMLALRHQTERYLRQSSLRIAQLREVVGRIQAGEEVDVEKALGTGDPQREAEWEEVLQAIERDEVMRKPGQQQQKESGQQQQKQKQQTGPKDSTSKADVAPHDEMRQPPAKAKPTNFGNFF